MKKQITSPQAPAVIGPYSQAIKIENFLFISGQIATADGKLIQGGVAEQAKLVMKNLRAVLEAAGASFDDVVKTTIFLIEMADFAEVNEVYGSFMSQPYPARETVSVKQLPLNASVEISMVAYIRE